MYAPQTTRREAATCLTLFAVLDALLGVVLLTMVTRVIAAKIRALLWCQRNHRWVRNRPRPAYCPGMAGRGHLPPTAGVVRQLTGHRL